MVRDAQEWLRQADYDFNGKDYWARIDILSDAVYQVFAPIQAIAMTPQEWESKESPICDFAQKGENCCRIISHRFILTENPFVDPFVDHRYF